MIPDEHFLDDVILLTGDVIHPYTTALFKHTAIFGKIDEPFYKYALATIKETRKVGFVQLMNPLVGNMGVSGALFLGFKNIYMFGLDNGKRSTQVLCTQSTLPCITSMVALIKEAVTLLNSRVKATLVAW